jgi:class 3 adenylate cyclase
MKGGRAGEREDAILVGDTRHWTKLAGRHGPEDV